MKRLLFLLVLLLTVSAGAFGQRNRIELIVTVRDGQSIDRINSDNQSTTLKRIRGTNTYLLAREGDADQALRKLRQDSRVQIVELNSKIQLNDSAETIFLLDDSAETIFLLDTKAILNGVEVPQAYARQQALSIIEGDKVGGKSTGAATRVAIIDTGVDFNHPALKPWLDPGADLVNGSSASVYDGLKLGDSAETIFLLDDGQRVTTIPSSFGHGTLVAGVIHLVAPDAVLVPIKAFDPYGNTSMFTIIQAVYTAIEMKADVINMSFSTAQYSLTLMQAINYGRSMGAALVSSMGNEGHYTNSVYPAAYMGVFGVAATDFQDHVASFSNYGSIASISAPGTTVISTAPGGRYAAVSGTSFSAPLVSGTISLVASLVSRGNPQGPQVLTSAEPIDAKNPGFEKMLGKGRVNARRALEQK